MVARHEDGTEWVVPGFWAGGEVWRVRFAPQRSGKHSVRTVCSDSTESGLHGFESEFVAVDYAGDNPLLRKGPLRVAADRRHFEHEDGSPFLWLGDTWWMGLSKRMDWPRGFQTLAMDRAEKGYNLIQIVAGPYPDMTAFDARAANEAGFAWTADFGEINPEYYNFADRRIAYLVESGLVPAIVACWGYHLLEMGIDKVKRHWRNLIARYGAYPVVWILAGETGMPFYLSETKEADTEKLREAWTEVARYVREVDPFHRPLTAHPRQDGRLEVVDDSVLDFDMLQTGHGDRVSLPHTVAAVSRSRAAEPQMPTLVGEVCYEGIGESCRQEVQRMLFWTSMLSGAAGHTYGANGIWQVNTPEQPYGPSPHGLAWGGPSWQDAAQLPGSRQIGLGKRLLERFEWWKMEPHPEWVKGRYTDESPMGAYAAGIPGKLRIVYWPSAFAADTIQGIEPGVQYRAYLFSPINAEEIDLGEITPDDNGVWKMPLGAAGWHVMPIFQDWVLVMEVESCLELWSATRFQLH